MVGYNFRPIENFLHLILPYLQEIKPTTSDKMPSSKLTLSIKWKTKGGKANIKK